MDRWKSLPIQCVGGLVLNMDSIGQGTTLPGSALILENYEPALEGGYRRILGYTKFDAAQVPGTTGNPVLGVAVGLGGVIACRRTNSPNDYALYYSSGSGWTKINPTARANTVTKMRGIYSAIISPAMILLDGANYAAKWDGTTFTEISAHAPIGPKYAAIIGNRLAIAGHPSDPSELILSEPNTDIGFHGGSGAASIPCSDVIVGLKTFRESLYIYCKNSIKKLVGDSTSNFALQDVTNSIGCLSGDTIQELGGDLLFLAPDGVRSTAGTERTNDIELGLVSRSIQPLIRQILAIGATEDTYSTCVIRNKSQYRLLLNQTSVAATGQVGFLGKLEQGRATNGNIQMVWSSLRGIQPYCADSSYENEIEISVIGAKDSGFVYRLESGNSFDGQPIKYIYRTPDITFTDTTIRKVMQKLEVQTQVEGDFTVDVRMLIDKGTTNLPSPSPINITQIGTLPTYGTAIYGTSEYGQIQFPVFKLNLNGSSFTTAFEFSGNNTNPPHRIDSFTIVFAPKSYR